MDITTLFPILASKTTTIDLESDNVFAKISSSMSSLAFFIFVFFIFIFIFFYSTIYYTAREGRPW